jgi:hypothetical protein
VKFLRNNPAVVMAGTAYVMIDKRGRRLRTVEPSTEHVEIQEQALRGINAIAHPTVMMRRNAVEAVGGYDVRWNYPEDLDMWLRLGEIGVVTNMAAVTLKYRVHEKSCTLANLHKHAESRRAIVEAAYARRRIDREYVAPKLPALSVGRLGRYDEAASRSYWALKEGERRTSLLYAAVAIRIAPWRIFGWKMAIRGLIGV